MPRDNLNDRGKINIKRKKRKIRKIIFITLSLIVLITWQYCLESSERKYYKNKYPGSLFQNHSHTVHAYKKGKGEQNIVFITGSGTPNAYTDFYNLQNELSRDAVTISYDRAGFGWSTSGQVDCKVDSSVEELDILLTKMKLKGKFTLIAHSLGGLEALRYAQIYPEKVERIIFWIVEVQSTIRKMVS